MRTICIDIVGIIFRQRFWLVVCVWMVWFCPGAGAQEEQVDFIDNMRLLEIENRMLYFYDQLQEISSLIPEYAPEDLDKAEVRVSVVDAKWDVYYQSMRDAIANDDSLLQIVANYQVAKQSALDSIAYRKHFFEARASFDEAEAFLLAQDSVYAHLYDTALGYSLVKSLGAELERVKGKEQLLAEEARGYYESAKDIAQEFDELSPRFSRMEEVYIGLRNTSENIQALEYKSWIQRVKDYLYSFAAVALILMFLNMLQAKWKAFKQARENARKLAQMMNRDENEYPTI